MDGPLNLRTQPHPHARHLKRLPARSRRPLRRRRHQAAGRAEQIPRRDRLRRGAARLLPGARDPLPELLDVDGESGAVAVGGRGGVGPGERRAR